MTVILVPVYTYLDVWPTLLHANRIFSCRYAFEDIYTTLNIQR